MPRVGPRLRLYLRLIAFGGLEGIAHGVAESIVKERGVSDGLGLSQSYAAQMILFYGLAYGLIALAVTLVFGYEPNPRRFKRGMALALIPLALVLSIAVINEALRYPASHDISDLFLALGHVAFVLWLSQYVARKYLDELSQDNQAKKKV